MVRTDESGRQAASAGGGFRTLAEEQLPRLYRLARRLVGDEAEDAVQDALLKAYRSYDRLEDAAAGPAWLTAILVNCCRDRARARARRPEEVELGEVEEFSLFRRIADEDPFPYSDSLHLDFLQQFGAEDVRAVLASLPARYRVPLVLVYWRATTSRRSRSSSASRSGRCSRASTAAASCSSGGSGTTPTNTDS